MYLISNPKLCKDLQCLVTFTNDHCFLQSTSLHQMLLGSFKSGLHYLEEKEGHHFSDSDSDPDPEDTFVAAIFSKENQN